MYYSYDNFLNDCRELIKKLKDANYSPDALLCIARGGMSLTHMLSIALNIRNVYSINAFSYDNNNTRHDLVLTHLPIFQNDLNSVLILDDTIDTGHSMSAVFSRMNLEFPSIEFKTACLVQKDNEIIESNFYARRSNEWIDFYWEVDLLKN